jgi:hypothetical protein
MPKTYPRKRQVGQRYGGVHDRTVDRMAEDGRISKPIYFGDSPIPFWDQDELDASDRAAASRAPTKARNPAEAA